MRVWLEHSRINCRRKGWMALPIIRNAKAPSSAAGPGSFKQLSRERFVAIKVKRVYESPELVDASCFLVDRLWPRGLKKEALRGIPWMKDVAPSDALRRWYGHDPKKWKEFQRRYFAELDGKQEAWEPILEAARRGGVALLYSARDTDHNNAVALRDYLAAKLKKG